MQPLNVVNKDMKLNREERRARNDTRHPYLDREWPKYKKLLYWAAKRLAYYLNTCRSMKSGFKGRQTYCPEDLYGVLFMRLNRMLWYYDPKYGQFSTLFVKNNITDIVNQIIRKDSEFGALDFRRAQNVNRGTDDGRKLINLGRLNPDSHTALVERDRKSWATDILHLLHDTDPGAIWSYIDKHLNKRDALILRWYFKDDLILDDIARKLGVTRQRAQQLKVRAMRTLKTALTRNPNIKSLVVV